MREAVEEQNTQKMKKLHKRGKKGKNWLAVARSPSLEDRSRKGEDIFFTFVKSHDFFDCLFYPNISEQGKTMREECEKTFCERFVLEASLHHAVLSLVATTRTSFDATNLRPHHSRNRLSDKF